MPTEPRFRIPSAAWAGFLVTLVMAAVTPCVSRAEGSGRGAYAPARPSDAAAPPSSHVVADDERDETDVERDVDFEHRHEAEFFRRIAGGDMTLERMQRMWAAASAMPNETPLGVQSVNAWQLAGPVFSTNVGGGFMTGRVRDIDPINIRALAASGGLWRFDIFGGIPMSDVVPASWFGSFASRPTDANTILLGTGEFAQSGQGTGLYKTTDGGTTWNAKPMSPTPSSFSRVRWSPDGGTAYASGNQGFFRSTDAGESWVQTLTASVSDFSITVGSPAQIWATLNGGVWRSTDAGQTWNAVTSGGAPQGMTTSLGTVSAVNFVAGGNVWVYVAFDTRIWRSLTNGSSWTEITPANFGIGNSNYGPVISADPVDPQYVLYGNVPYCRSSNSGTNWDKLASPHLHADYHMFAWDPDGVGVWAANDGGWSHSSDRGVTWSSSSNAMPISQFYSIDCEKTELGYMVGGTQDNNVLYTPSPALNWIDPRVGFPGSTEGDAYGAVVNLYDPTQMWAVSGELNGPIAYARYRTTDGGTNWNEVDSGIDPTSFRGGSIRSDNAFPVRLVASTDTFVYESLDGGSTWTKSNSSPFPANITTLTSSTRVAPSAVLYATLAGATAGQRLFVRDGGTWVERSSGLPVGAVIKVVPHPWAAYADEAWAIMNASFSNRFFHTTDRGVTWTNVTGDFPAGVPVSDLVPNPRAPGELYVGTLNGCFRSRNGGVNWERWNDGMPQGVIVSEMTYIDLTTTTGQFFVVAAAYGRSVWKRDVSGGDVFPTLEVSAPFVQEGDAGQNTAWFRVHLPKPQFTPVSVDYSTQDSTGTLAGNDYVATSGSLVIPAFKTDAWVGVQVNGDVQIEADEAFKLVLSNPLRALVGNPGVGTIQDDDAHGLVCGGLPGTDGTVNAIAVDGGTVYIGGSFNRVGPSSGNAASLDVTTGLPISLPKVDGSVNALAADGAGGWYLGGSFHHVAGAPRTGLAHLLADGTLAPWNPCADEIVFGLAVSHDTVYVGGRFTTISGVPMPYLAALSGSTGLPILALPVPNDQVLGIALNGPRLYVAGSFTTIGGSSRNYLASLDRVTGAVGTWNPNPNAAASALLLNGGSLYVGGNFSSIGGLPRSYIAAIDPVSGAAQPWNPVSDSYVFTIAADAGAIYAGGVFDNIGGRTMTGLAALDRVTGLATPWTPNVDGSVNALVVSGGTLYVGGAFSTAGGQPRNGLAALSTSSGAATAWNPNPSGSVAVLGVNGNTVFAGGYITGFVSQPRSSLAAFDANTGQLLPWDPRANSTVFALVASGGIVYAGGQFDSIGTQARSRLAAIDGVTGVPTSWDPSANGTVRTLLLSGARIYAGGSFTTMGGVTRNRGAAISTSTAVPPTSWNPNATSTINALATDGTFIYAGGAFTSIGGSAHLGLAQLNTTSGGSNPTWNPNTNGTVTMLVNIGSGLYVGGSFTQIAGLSRPRLAAIDLSTAAVLSWAPAPNNTVNALAVWGTQVYVGGAFTAIGGQWRNHLALLRPSTNQVSDWAPEPDGNVNAIALNGIIAYVGGAFTTLGGLPQAHVGCLIPSGYVDAPAATAGTPLAVRLSPNPAAGRVRIEYTLPVAARVSIAVYDVQGRRVGSALDALQEAGVHATTWERSLARTSPGIYFVRFAAGKQSVVRRLVLL